MPALVSSNHTKKELSVESKDEDDPDPSDKDLAITRTALGHLLPLFSDGSLASISFKSMTSSFLGSIMDQCPEQLFSIKLLRIADVTLPIIPSIVRWLCTERADGEPRLARVSVLWKNDDTIFAVQVYEAIRQVLIVNNLMVIIVLCFFSNFWPPPRQSASSSKSIQGMAQRASKRPTRIGRQASSLLCAAAATGQLAAVHSVWT